MFNKLQFMDEKVIEHVYYDQVLDWINEIYRREIHSINQSEGHPHHRVQFSPSSR